MMRTKWISPALALAILLGGCASDHPTLGAWRSDGSTPKRTDKIAVVMRPNPTTEDAALGHLLTAELKRAGFHLVPLAQADYTLGYVVEKEAVETYLPERDFAVSSPPQTTRQFLASADCDFNSVLPGTAPSLGPAVTVYHSKGIRLYLFTNPRTHGGRSQIAWSGCIDAGQNISAQRAPLLIETLLGYFGQEYAGRVNLGRKPGSQSGTSNHP